MRLAALVCVATLAAADVGGAAAPRVAVEATAPRTVGLADTFDYVVEATVPLGEASTAELRAGVGPFTVLDAEPLERERRGDAVVLRLARTLACVDEGCVGKELSLRAVLPRPVVQTGSGAVSGRPAVVSVRGRIPPATVRPRPDAFRADTSLPAAGGPAPTTVVRALAATSLAALLAAVLVALAALRPRAASGVDPLARAIRLLRESARRPEADRRRAADLLARVVGDRDRGPLAAEARHVAWAPPGPTADAVEKLADHAAREGA